MNQIPTSTNPNTIRRRESAHRNREEWIKENGPCRTCGAWDDLTVDHIDPSTKDPALRHGRGGGGSSMKRLWKWGAARRAVELAKCQVLCGPCHRQKNRTEAGWELRFPAPREDQLDLLRDRFNSRRS